MPAAVTPPAALHPAGAGRAGQPVAAALPGPVRLQLLGDFRLSVGGAPVAVAPAAQRLLALLAVGRRPLERDHIVGTLWPEASAARGAGSLRSTLWRLAQLPAAPLSACVATVRLAPELQVDVADAERLMRRVLARRPAAGLHAGHAGHAEDVGHADDAERTLSQDLLPGWWDEWVVLERERLRQLRLHALEALSVAHRTAGRYARALDVALLAVAGEPLRDSGHRRVVEVHLAEGNPTEALRHYDSYRRMLRRELGLPPSAPLRSLVAPLLAAAAQAADAADAAAARTAA